MIITGVIFALGAGLMTISQLPMFVASVPQFVGSAIVILALIVLAFMLPRRDDGERADAQTAPGVLLVGGTSFVLGSAFMILATIVQSTIPASLNVAALLLLLVVGGVLVWRWSHRASWNEEHTFSVAGGLLLVYAWYGFVQVPSVTGTDPTLDLIGNAVFASLAIALLFFARHRVKASPHP